MRLTQGIKNWWKVKTGKDDSPFDGETPFWVFSLFVHIVLLVVLGTSFVANKTNERVAVVVPPADEAELEEMPPLFEFNYETADEIGTNDDDDFQATMQLAPNPEDMIVEETSVEQEIRDLGELKLTDYLPEEQSSMSVNSIAVNGIAGYATTGTDGAVDRITHEILLSLEERKTLVVWMFDQSASLLRQREDLVARFDHIYDELDKLQAAGAEEFKKHDDIPLLTQVVAFGNRSQAMLKKPSADVKEIKDAVRAIDVDTSGVENVFGTVVQVAQEVKSLCKVNRRTGQRERNVMVIVLSDESGDDVQNLEAAVEICKNNQIRVYVIGVPAPFGRDNTYVKWVDPDPNFDQSVQWAPVKQGPESFLPERVKLHFTAIEEEEELFDSGFGPYGLTRLCFQSGGIYFTVHPNRKADGRRVRPGETAAYSAYLSRFFDPEVMRRYRPDYTSEAHYRQLVNQNKARYSLVAAAYQSRVRPMVPPQMRFEKLNEATFVNEVTMAQRAAAVLEPKINELYEILKQGEHDRESEISPRWKAGYDLAMGRVMAVKIRAESYNMMLAMAKTKLKFEDERNNTWILEPFDEVTTGSQAEKLAEKATMYLERVVEEHPETPWAYLAAAELRTPIGWRWVEAYTEPPAPPPQVERPPNNNNNNNNQPQQPRQPRQQPPPKPKRSPPKL